MATFDLAGNQDDYNKHVDIIRKVIEHHLSDKKITQMLEEDSKKKIFRNPTHREQCKKDLKNQRQKLLNRLAYVSNKGRTIWKVDLYHRMYNYCVFLQNSLRGHYYDYYRIEYTLGDIIGSIKERLEDTWGSFHEQRTPHHTTATQFIYDSCLLDNWLQSRGFKGLKINIEAIIPEPHEKYKNAIRVVYTDEYIDVVTYYNDKEF